MFSKFALLLLAVSIANAGRPQNTINLSNSGSASGTTGNFGAGTGRGSTTGQRPISTGSSSFPSTGSGFQTEGSIPSGSGSSSGTFSGTSSSSGSGSSSGTFSGTSSSSGSGSSSGFSSGSSFQSGSSGNSGFGSNSGSVSGNCGPATSSGGNSDRGNFGSRVSSGFVVGSNSGTGNIIFEGQSGQPASGSFGRSSFGSGNRGPVIFAPGQSGQARLQFGQNLGQIGGITITITETQTIDSYVTVTDVILNSGPVTLTGFELATVTVTTFGTHQTEVDDLIALRTTVVERPTTELVTTAKTNFIYVTDLSVEVYTITHSAYLIHQTTHTTFATQTLTISSPVVRTHLITSVGTSTVFQTIVNTVVVRGYN